MDSIWTFFLEEGGVGLSLLALMAIAYLLTSRKRAAILATEDGQRMVRRMELLMRRQILAFGCGMVITVAVVLAHGAWFDRQPFGALLLILLYLAATGLCLAVVLRLWPVPVVSPVAGPE